MDKTERLQRGIISRTLNSDAVAEDTWNSIYDPITETMIKTGIEEPTAEELAALGGRTRESSARQYFDRQGPEADERLAAGMKKFHSRWIKETILYGVGLRGGDKTLLELACGVAGDLHKWMRMNVSFVLGIDYAAKNIMDTEDSAYTRYMNQAIERGGLEDIPPMVFAIADCSKSLVDGSAGSNEEEKDILRSVFGKVRPVGSVPPFVEQVGASRLKQGADCVSCMFAIHYMFESSGKFNGFLRNLSETLKVGGYFIGCCPDGEKVFDLLRGVESKKGQEGDTVLWDITKQYDADEIPEGDGGFGLGIDVEFISIGKGHREYLVPFQLLEDKMRTIGCELLNAEELKDIGMVNSTATFDVSYAMSQKKGEKFAMGPAIQEFSFLNRWFIFKRKRQESMAAAAAPANVVPSAKRMNEQPAANVGRSATVKKNAQNAAAAATAVQESEAAALNRTQLRTAQVAEAANTTALSPGRTVPVARGPAADPATARSYTEGEVFLFYGKAGIKKDVLGIKDPGAGRWLAPSSRFPIEDTEDKTIYPTVDHYIAGMRVKLASDKPELAKSLFSREGTIHQKFLTDRLALTDAGTKPMSEEEDARILESETAAVKDAMRPPYLKRYKATIDEGVWATLKNGVIQTAIEQRWAKDARFRKIVEAARDRGKYLLFYTPGGTTSNVGGIRSTQSGQIEGENLIGKAIMKLAGYPD